MAGRVAHSLVQALQVVPAFANLDEHTLVHIVGASENLFWSAGSAVFEKDSPGDALYIVLSGRIGIFDVDDGKEVQLATIGVGDFFGEFSLLLHTTHTKVARALEDSELMVLPKESLQELLNANPALGDHLRRKMEERFPADSLKPS
jgi:CRP/FNR family transcriptional regulator, cyclic AMP receptor protein